MGVEPAAGWLTLVLVLVLDDVYDEISVSLTRIGFGRRLGTV